MEKKKKLELDEEDILSESDLEEDEKTAKRVRLAKVLRSLKKPD